MNNLPKIAGDDHHQEVLKAAERFVDFVVKNDGHSNVVSMWSTGLEGHHFKKDICHAHFYKSRIPCEMYLGAFPYSAKFGRKFSVEMKPWIEFITRPEKSPWKDLLPYITLHCCDKSLPRVFSISDGKANKGMIMNFSVAARFPTEKPDNYRMWLDCMEQGFSETEAFVVASNYSKDYLRMPSSISLSFLSGGHHCISQRTGHKRFLTLNPDTDKIQTLNSVAYAPRSVDLWHNLNSSAKYFDIDLEITYKQSPVFKVKMPVTNCKDFFKRAKEFFPQNYPELY